MQFKPDGTVGAVVTPTKPDASFSLEGKPVFNPGGEPQVLEIKDPRGGPVNSWSFSTLSKFEQCPHAVFLGKVMKIPDESGEAAKRGVRIHKVAEDFVAGRTLDEGTQTDESGFPVELKKFKSAILELRHQYASGNIEQEGEWAFDIDWVVSDWRDGKTTWSRNKLDVFHRQDETSATVIDYKTGKKFGNEIKHGQQGALYAICAFMRHPELEFIRVEFWYIDSGETLIKTYTRQQALRLLDNFEKRAIKLTSATEFHPKPSAHNCRFCSYKEKHCEWGVN